MALPIDNSIIVPALATLGFLWVAVKQVHYERRDDAVIMGLGLIAIGISLIIFNPTLTIFGLPLAIFPLVQAVAGIGLTVKREDIGNEIILHGWACFAMAIFVIIVQFGILKL